MIWEQNDNKQKKIMLVEQSKKNQQEKLVDMLAKAVESKRNTQRTYIIFESTYANSLLFLFKSNQKYYY